jgi:hypothetical protein
VTMHSRNRAAVWGVARDVAEAEMIRLSSRRKLYLRCPRESALLTADPRFRPRLRTSASWSRFAGRSRRVADGPSVDPAVVVGEGDVVAAPMLGAAPTQDTVRLVRYGVRKLIDAVAAADEDAGQRLDEGLEFDYQRRSRRSIRAKGLARGERGSVVSHVRGGGYEPR